MPLIDGRDRRVEYLRLSLTERCNLACSYCMPHDHAPLPSDWMSDDEIVRLVAALQPLGVRHVRLTGGEPTLRPRLPDLVRRLAALGLHDLAMTTNGTRMVDLAKPLRDAGLSRINLSLDTLFHDKFWRLSGARVPLKEVLDGARAIGEAGFVHGKLNVVALRGVNDAELPALARFAWAHQMVPRFIELMPMSGGEVAPRSQMLVAADIRRALSDAFGALVETDGELPGVGPARYMKTPSGERIGIIAAVTERFCEGCNRIRISARGRLHACLGLDDPAPAVNDRYNLRCALALGPDALRNAVRTIVATKAEGHAFALSTSEIAGGPRRHMVVIGG